MSVRDFLVAVRVHWWLPVVGMVVGGTAAFLLTSLQAPTYTSDLQFFVASTGSTTPAEAYQGSLFSQQQVASYAALVSGTNLSHRIIQETGIDTPPASLAQQLSALPVPDTVLIDVTVAASSPQEALRIAQAVGSQFPRLVAELETSPGRKAEPPVRVAIAEKPELPGAPTSPHPIRNLAVGLILGALVGLALPVLRGFRMSLHERPSSSAI
jgi:capsular polysaccharide biosynthesis protein